MFWVGHWGLFPNFEVGAYVEHDSLESLNPHLSISVLTETFDYIALIRGQSPNKFCLVAGGQGRGGVGLDPNFGEKVWI